ncbi:hypothetical protein MFUR16E_04735 [Methylobacterium fujisawaense]|uniref:hypothetical protein n=1 Tax=Methylobacterium fujisawaense TaxID=107400 RepID=UPI002F345523
MANSIVVLTKPIIGHAVVRQLEFREPTWRHIMAVGGEPYVRAPSPGKPGFFQIVPIAERVQAYAERLIAVGDKDGDPTHLLQLGIADTNKVQDVILGFFLDVDPLLERRPPDAGLSTSSTSSSTTSDGDTEISLT